MVSKDLVALTFSRVIHTIYNTELAFDERALVSTPTRSLCLLPLHAADWPQNLPLPLGLR
jgi:hypothetical protein